MTREAEIEEKARKVREIIERCSRLPRESDLTDERDSRLRRERDSIPERRLLAD